MVFKSSKQEEIFNKVKSYLKEIFGEVNLTIKDQYIFGTRGTTCWRVEAVPINEEDLWIIIEDYVTVDTPIRGELLRWLLDKQKYFWLGKFSIEPNKNDPFKCSIFLSHTMLGSTLDKKELMLAVDFISSLADKYDEEITKCFGGLTFKEWYLSQQK